MISRRYTIALPEMLAPSVSPDGRWVAWTWLGRDPVACVYVAATDGTGAPRRLTHIVCLNRQVHCYECSPRGCQ
jgi:Tol biopolymer transport system component